MKTLSLNIADLWVATAINADNEEVFENNDADLEEPFETVFDVDCHGQVTVSIRGRFV